MGVQPVSGQLVGLPLKVFLGFLYLKQYIDEVCPKSNKKNPLRNNIKSQLVKVVKSINSKIISSIITKHIVKGK